MIVILWVFFLVLINTIFFSVRDRLYTETAEKKLKGQSHGLLQQLPVIVENGYQSQIAQYKLLFSKLKAISFALESYESIDQAKPLLDDIAQNIEVVDLTVYDRNGKILYGHGEGTISERISSNEICSIIDSDSYMDALRSIETNGSYSGILFMNNGSINDNQDFYWAVGERWLISMKSFATEAQREVERVFEWGNVLKGIRIGRTGSVLAIDEENGKVLVCPESSFIGSEMGKLGMRTDVGVKTVDDLKAQFGSSDSIVKLEINGKKFFSSILDMDSIVILILMPLAEAKDDVNSAFGTLIVLLDMVTGLCMFYTLLHLAPTKQDNITRKGRLVWNKTKSEKMLIVLLLTLVGVLTIGLYLEVLANCAQSFSYTQAKVDDVVDLLDYNEQALEKVKESGELDAVSRSNLASCILNHADKSDVTSEYLSKLAESLDVSGISIISSNGNAYVSNSSYRHITIAGDSPFRSILDGTRYPVTVLVEDNGSGSYVQMVGVPVWEGESGAECVILTSDSAELGAMRRNLGFEGIFKQIGLTDGTVVLVANDDDLTIEFMAGVEDGFFKSQMEILDYTGLSVEALGVEEKRLVENSNGNIFMMKNKYFASVRHVDDSFVIVMRPQQSLTFVNYLPVLFSMLMTLLFMTTLTSFSCMGETEVPSDDDAKKSETVKDDEETEEDEKSHPDDIIAMLDTLFSKKKPYFEERWPRDLRKWKDCTPEERFSKVSKAIIIVAMASIVILAILAGEHSVWYYCLSGNWGTGINLYSATSCIISICILGIIKMFVHKLMFLIARTAGARGETICHLTDSFSGYVIVIVGIFLCLYKLGVNMTALSLTGGVAGVVFGIGCQNIVADILAGIIMAFDGSVHVGDLVSYNGQFGVVLSIGVRNTTLKWFGDITIIRNNDFKNFIRRPADEQARVIASLKIDQNESLERINEILDRELPIIHEHLCTQTGDEIIGPIFRGIDNIDESGMALSFSILCKGMLVGLIPRSLNMELKLLCERNGIKLSSYQIMLSNPEKEQKKA